LTSKTKAVLIVIAGLILMAIGVFASILLTRRMQADQVPATANESMIKTNVVVVTRDLFLGDQIAATDLSLASVPVEIVPRDAITNLD